MIYSCLRTKIPRNSQNSDIIFNIIFSGLGFGPGIPGLQAGLGVGAGCGVGFGFGYGMGKGVAYDATGGHSNVGKLFQKGQPLPGQ